MGRLLAAAFLVPLLLIAARMESPPSVPAALFYYNRTQGSDLPVLNNHGLVVLNHPSQFTTILPQLTSVATILYYHLPNFCVEATGEWAVANANEDWFLHDGLGNRIRFPGSNPPYIYWFMDVGHPGYQAFKLAQYQSILAQAPQLDGFYLDFPSIWDGFAAYTAPQLDCCNNIPPGNTPPPAFTSRAAWDAFHHPQIAALRTTLGVPLVANDWLYGPLSQAAGGGFGEHMFCYHWGSGFYGESAWRAQVDLLASADLAGCRALVLSTHNASVPLEQALRFSVASFLLGRRIDGEPCFSFRDGADSSASPVYYDLYDLDIGLSDEPYAVDGGIYHRDYERGLVVVNPGPVERTMAIAPIEGWADLDGRTMTGSVTLAPKTAQIFKVAPEHLEARTCASAGSYSMIFPLLMTVLTWFTPKR